jgi:hypothetical protein
LGYLRLRRLKYQSMVAAAFEYRPPPHPENVVAIAIVKDLRSFAAFCAPAAYAQFPYVNSEGAAGSN